MIGIQNQSSERRQYMQAAKARIAAAEFLLQGETENKEQIAAYLTHIALECALKARIAQEAEKMRRPLQDFPDPQTHRDYFRSSKGHQLEKLAHDACLRRALDAAGQLPLLQAESLRYLSGSPYWLRYGERAVSDPHAQAALCFAHRLIASLGILP